MNPPAGFLLLSAFCLGGCHTDSLRQGTVVEEGELLADRVSFVLVPSHCADACGQPVQAPSRRILVFDRIPRPALLEEHPGYPSLLLSNPFDLPDAWVFQTEVRGPLRDYLFEYRIMKHGNLPGRMRAAIGWFDSTDEEFPRPITREVMSCELSSLRGGHRIPER